MGILSWKIDNTGTFDSYKWLTGDDGVWYRSSCCDFQLHQRVWLCAPQTLIEKLQAINWPGCLSCAMDFWLTHKLYSVCCSECPRGLSWGPFQLSSFTSVELLSYKYRLRSNWLCMPMKYCCTGLLGKHLTINFCSRMLKHLENGLTIAIWHSKSKAMVFSRRRHPVPAPSYFSLSGSRL